MRAFILILLFLSFATSSIGLQWKLAGEGNDSWREIKPSFFYLRRNFTPFIAEIVPQPISLNNCHRLKQKLDGKIVLVSYGRCSIERHLQVVKEAGGIGIIMISDGWISCNLQDIKKYKHKLPTICISSVSSSFKRFYANFTQNIKLNKTTLIDFTPGINPYDKLNRGGMIFRMVWMLVLSGTLILFSSFKLFQFLYYERKGKIYAKAIIIIGLIYSIILFINNIDKYAYLGWIRNFQFQVLTLSLRYFIFFQCIVLIGMVHMKIVLKVTGKEYLKIYCYIFFICLLIFVEAPLTASIITYCTYKRTTQIYIFLSSFTATFFGISIVSYFLGSFILIWKLRKTLDISCTNQTEKAKKYLRFSRLVILFGFLMFLAFICVIVSSTRNYLYKASEFIIVTFALDNLLAYSSFVKLFMFDADKH